MQTGNDDTSTIREVAAVRRGRAATPVLLVGSFVPKTARVVSLDGPVTIGRGQQADGGVRNRDADVLSHSDPTLSRQHARIVRDTDGWTVEDLQTKNGTLVDGRRAAKPMVLWDGSIVMFGGYAGVFRRVSDDELDAIETELASPFGPVATLSPALAVTAANLRRLAKIDSNLLFVGETGVGKEVFARAVHAASGRKGEFVAINCAALPADLVESELFGYARGAHSTATQAKQGLVELANGGRCCSTRSATCRRACR